MTDFETIRYEVGESVATITLARPDKRNAISQGMFEELGDATERAARDKKVRAVLVRGEGASFCAGIDVTSFGEMLGADEATHRAFITLAQRPFLNLQTMPKPAVAAVQGHAVGAGFQLALACDIRVLSDDAVLGMLEIRFGLVPDLGGNRPLTRLVGPALAKDLSWTGRTVDASEAHRIGLGNRLVPPDDLAMVSAELVRELASKPPIPVSGVKELVDRAPSSSVEEMLRAEAAAQVRCLQSDDHREAVAAFFEKRPPRFTGS
jgi:enoyl-CoA hydratase/carnithine racemase